jgi:hypothetical protein
MVVHSYVLRRPSTIVIKKDMIESEEQKSLLHDFQAYIDAFNTQNLDAVASHLDDALYVTINEEIAIQGKQAILQTYPPDFAKNKQVSISRQPVVKQMTIHPSSLLIPPPSRSTNDDSNNDKYLIVDVELTASVPGEAFVTVLDVQYIYDISTKRQICHKISNVRIVDHPIAE